MTTKHIRRGQSVQRVNKEKKVRLGGWLRPRARHGENISHIPSLQVNKPHIFRRKNMKHCPLSVKLCIL